jgi:hypothetical protein
VADLSLAKAEFASAAVGGHGSLIKYSRCYLSVMEPIYAAGELQKS